MTVIDIPKELFSARRAGSAVSLARGAGEDDGLHRTVDVIALLEQ